LIQRENPGGYELYPYVESEIQLKLKVDNWKYLEASINSVNKIGSSVDRINYLLEIFKWHPFKHDIFIRLSVEDSISTKQVQDLIWNIAANNYLTKSKLYDCPLLDYEEENYFQLAFRLFKRTAANKYEWSMDKIIDNLKSQIDYMAHKESTDVNEAFIIELLKFLKINPVSSWEKDVAELNIIINKNEVYYNHLFCAAMRNEINLN
jgi:hypothetical protein